LHFAGLAGHDFLADYPSPRIRSPARRWILLGFEFGAILPIIFFGILDLAPIISATDSQTPPEIDRLRVVVGLDLTNSIQAA
jgi:hypothetical protein